MTAATTITIPSDAELQRGLQLVEQITTSALTVARVIVAEVRTVRVALRQ